MAFKRSGVRLPLAPPSPDRKKGYVLPSKTGTRWTAPQELRFSPQPSAIAATYNSYDLERCGLASWHGPFPVSEPRGRKSAT